MGALNAAQLFTAIRKEHASWEERLARGEVTFIRDWLAEKIWSKASSLDSQDLMIQATGATTNPSHFLSHLKSRYLEK